MAVRLLGLLGEMHSDRQRRPDKPARAVRLEDPNGLPCTPKCPSCGTICMCSIMKCWCDASCWWLGCLHNLILHTVELQSQDDADFKLQHT